MPSVYLAGGDLATYGVPNATPGQITQASTLVDAYMKRPEGLVWTPDANGMPAFMAALSPTFSFTLSALSPGQNVPVVISGGSAQALQTGDVLIVDRTNTEIVEACVIASITGANAILQNVQFAHSGEATGDYGLLIEEQKNLPGSRPITSLSRCPLINIVSGTGRYAYGRRGDASNYNMEQFNLLAALSKFGGPPVWELFQVLNIGIDMQTGQVWIPAGVMLAYYSEVKLRYVAGFSAVNVPSAVKLACAELIQANTAAVAPPNVKMYQAGDTKIENFAATLFSSDTKLSLQPYMARLYA